MRTRIKHFIVLLLIAVLVIIEKENHVISRVTEKLSENSISGKVFSYNEPNSRSMASQNSSLSTAAVSMTNDASSPRPRADRNGTVRAARRLAPHQTNVSSVPPKPSRKHIVLLTTTRTGSSFIGEFFNQHKGMFYLFEPFWHVERTVKLAGPYTASATALSIVYRDVLRQLLLCDVPSLEGFLEPPPQEHVTGALFRRGSSQALCEEPACGGGVGGRASSSSSTGSTRERFPCRMRRCEALNLTLAAQACLLREHVAIKTVRIRNLPTLRAVVDDPRLDVKIIQLVRDPRAVLASRMVAMPGQYEAWEKWKLTGAKPDDLDISRIKNTCDNMKITAEMGWSGGQWLRGRYMLARYEDVSREPLAKAQEMYRFAGVDMDASVVRWIERNTRATEPMVAVKRVLDIGDVFSTARNSAKQAERWRLSIPFAFVQAVQEVCAPTLRMFGYRLATSALDLANMNVSLVEEHILGVPT
ncbi:carbohydrate sulfotransferase 3-like [Lethenteron reissneri]|uniref:carbohydrate sulfotransferase 3-like n=1 Tax=Lethenteron reissneri TaxID=7753 RepID=UPI002AB73AEE|nr:carbohydrate sulfotransferase 3-like [Lethenteron reissneri]